MTVEQAMTFINGLGLVRRSRRFYLVANAQRFVPHDIQCYDANVDDEVYLMHAPWDPDDPVLNGTRLAALLDGYKPTARLCLWIGGRHQSSYDILSIIRAVDGSYEVNFDPLRPRGRPR